MGRKHAFLQNNTVVRVDTIEATEYSALARQYQLLVDIEDMQPQPQVGWRLFTNRLLPAAAPTDPVAYVRDMVLRPAKAFALQLEEDFVAENIAMGITQAGRVRDVADVLAQVSADLAAGSLYAVLADLEQVPIDPELAPFITAERIRRFKNRVRVYLGFPEV